MTGSRQSTDRWLIVTAGVFLQVALGTVYSWSFFQEPVVEAFRCSQSAAAWAFSTAICFLGLAAGVGGLWLPIVGPRKLAVGGAILYSIGWMIGSFAVARGNLWLLYVGFGVVGGSGLGLGYVTPVATVAKWFPDRKGLITGMVLMGFGFGALVMSKIIAPLMMRAFDHDLEQMFFTSSIVIGVLGIPAAALMRNPPADCVASSTSPPTPNSAGDTYPNLTVRQCLLSGRFALMWSLFFCNITAGIMFIGFQSPMLQDLLRASGSGQSPESLAATGATLIAASAVFNGLGRLFWGGVADKVGRIQAFRLILGSQALVFLALMFVANPWIFGLLVCYVMFCYGGGFGAMPSYVLDTFGGKLMPAVYGSILTAWSTAGIAGPQLVGLIRDRAPAETVRLFSFAVASGLLVVALGFSLVLSNKPFRGRRVE